MKIIVHLVEFVLTFLTIQMILLKIKLILLFDHFLIDKTVSVELLEIYFNLILKHQRLDFYR